MNVAPWHESLAVLSIETAVAKSTFRFPLAGTAQPLPPLSCGDVTVTLDVLQPL